MTTTCACGNTLIWLSEREAGECDACTRHRNWQQVMDRWARKDSERQEPKAKGGDDHENATR